MRVKWQGQELSVYPVNPGSGRGLDLTYSLSMLLESRHLTTVKPKWSCSLQCFVNPCVVIYRELETGTAGQDGGYMEKSRAQPPKNRKKNDLHHSSKLQYMCKVFLLFLQMIIWWITSVFLTTAFTCLLKLSHFFQNSTHNSQNCTDKIQNSSNNQHN